MSETTKKSESQTAAVDPEELVSYTAPLDPSGEARDILVGVNGEFIRIQRGATVEIKRKFVEALNNADKQHLEARHTMDVAQQAAKSPLYEV